MPNGYTKMRARWEQSQHQLSEARKVIDRLRYTIKRRNLDLAKLQATDDGLATKLTNARAALDDAMGRVDDAKAETLHVRKQLADLTDLCCRQNNRCDSLKQAIVSQALQMSCARTYRT